MRNRDLQKYGLRYGAYDGALDRRFCIFEQRGFSELRHEFTTRREAMAWAERYISAHAVFTRAGLQFERAV